MKLLHVIGSMNPRTGGPCQGVRSLAQIASQQGKAIIEVVCLDDPSSEYLGHEALCVHALGKGGKTWGYHPALRPWLRANLPRFDAVILNGLWQYQSYALSSMAHLPTSPPYFVFPHGMLDPWFQKAPDRRMKAIRNWFYWKLVEQHVISRAEVVLFTCEEEMRLARATFRPYKPKHQINVSYGIHKPPAYSDRMQEAFLQKCRGAEGKPYFLFIGRIHPKKGVHFLIEGYSEFCRANPGVEHPNLVIAGPDLESPYGTSMQRLASGMCPPKSVFWPGMLTGDAKWGALYGCEASVLPSNQENFGISVVETMACGHPVLISDQVNIWTEIKEGGAGFVESNSVNGTIKLFQSWSSLSAEDKARMSAQAMTCFLRNFSIETTSRNLMVVVLAAISARKNR